MSEQLPQNRRQPDSFQRNPGAVADKMAAIARATTVFNRAADCFDAPALSFWNRFGQRTVDRLALAPGDRVLDVCCGSGASALPAAQQVGATGAVLGVDLAEALLVLARQKAQQQGLTQATFTAADFETLGLPSESFDAVVCVFGIFFVPDMVAAVRELWRMVRPGGQLAITSWGTAVFEPANRIFWEAIATERPDLYKQFTPWERIKQPASLQALLEAGGATQIEVVAELGHHELATAEDWWTMVLGGGCRGTIDQLDPAMQERVHQTNVHALQANAVQSLEVEVLYAIARK
jgi:ubiquinone/menaquinone biosynthesis C-methylase UbiE